MEYSLELHNEHGDNTIKTFSDEKSAKQAFEVALFMCFGTNSKIYLYDEKGLIDKWDFPKGARRF